MVGAQEAADNQYAAGYFRLHMNNENQDSIRDTIAYALSTICEDHGVCIAGITAEWLDVSTCNESKKLLTFLEIEVEL